MLTLQTKLQKAKSELKKHEESLMQAMEVKGKSSLANVIKEDSTRKLDECLIKQRPHFIGKKGPGYIEKPSEKVEEKKKIVFVLKSKLNNMMEKRHQPKLKWVRKDMVETPIQRRQVVKDREKAVIPMAKERRHGLSKRSKYRFKGFCWSCGKYGHKPNVCWSTMRNVRQESRGRLYQERR